MRSGIKKGSIEGVSFTGSSKKNELEKYLAKTQVCSLKKLAKSEYKKPPPSCPPSGQEIFLQKKLLFFLFATEIVL
jgi:hypothetical protein